MRIIRGLRQVGFSCTAIVGLAFALPPADASTLYAVTTCGASGTSNAWATQRTAPETHLRSISACSATPPDPYGDMTRGVGILDLVWGSTSPPGGELRGSDGLWAETRFTGPGGTRIRKAVVARELGHRYDAWTTYSQLDGADLPGETCHLGTYEVLCRVTGTTELDGLDAKTLAYGARCHTPWPECDIGATAHNVWALVLEARVTLEDLEAPVVGAVEVGGLNDGSWHRGGGEVVFTASDNTGVRERRLVEGSVVRGVAQAPGAAAGGCSGETGVAYTYTQPCAGARGINGRQAVSVASVCSWGDGVHSIRGSAVDTGGGAASTAAVSVKVDCAAPAVALGVGAATRPAGETVAPEVTVSDAASGLAGTTVEVSVDGGAWASYAAPLIAADGRTYRFRAKASDVAGNVGTWVYSDVVLGVAAPVVDRPPAGGHADGGHVFDEPVPPAPAPRSGPAEAAPPAPAAAATPLAPPLLNLKPRLKHAGLRILHTRTTKQAVTVSGAVARGFTGRVLVRLTAGGRSTWKRVRPHRGRWAVTLRRPAPGRARVLAEVAAPDTKPATARAGVA